MKGNWKFVRFVIAHARSFIRSFIHSVDEHLLPFLYTIYFPSIICLCGNMRKRKNFVCLFAASMKEKCELFRKEIDFCFTCAFIQLNFHSAIAKSVSFKLEKLIE